MSLRAVKPLRRALLGLAWVAFACKLLIPPGYMPAALGAGGPVRLCPGELPVGLLAGDTGNAAHGPHAGDEAHDGHAGHATSDEDAGRAEHGGASIREHCSLGALAATAALASAYVVAIPESGGDSIARAIAGIAAHPSNAHVRNLQITDAGRSRTRLLRRARARHGAGARRRPVRSRDRRRRIGQPQRPHGHHAR